MSRLLVGRGARAPVIGMVVGLLAGVGLSVGAANVVPGVQIGDPLAVFAVVISISVITVTSLMLPVRVMLRRSPMTRLRED